MEYVLFVLFFAVGNAVANAWFMRAALEKYHKDKLLPALQLQAYQDIPVEAHTFWDYQVPPKQTAPAENIMSVAPNPKEPRRPLEGEALDNLYERVRSGY
jgi:hypothetical protein